MSVQASMFNGFLFHAGSSAGDGCINGSSTGRMLLSAPLLQHSSMRDPKIALALLATSKSVRSMLHEHGRGCITGAQRLHAVFAGVLFRCLLIWCCVCWCAVPLLTDMVRLQDRKSGQKHNLMQCGLECLQWWHLLRAVLRSASPKQQLHNLHQSPKHSTDAPVDCFAVAALPWQMLFACQQSSSMPAHWTVRSTLLHG
jgi:hypothetical protein